MVFQSYALYPHMTVAGNLAFGLKLRGHDKASIAARVAEAAKTLELDQLLDRKPGALSGGQRQRVALGRALVRSEEHTSELQSLMRISYAVFCLNKKNNNKMNHLQIDHYRWNSIHVHTINTN